MRLIKIDSWQCDIQRQDIILDFITNESPPNIRDYHCTGHGDDVSLTFLCDDIPYMDIPCWTEEFDAILIDDLDSSEWRAIHHRALVGRYESLVKVRYEEMKVRPHHVAGQFVINIEIEFHMDPFE